MLRSTIYLLLTARLRKEITFVMMRTNSEVPIREFFPGRLKNNLESRYKSTINFLEGKEVLYGTRTDVSWKEKMAEDACECMKPKEHILIAQDGDSSCFDIYQLQFKKTLKRTVNHYPSPRKAFTICSATTTQQRDRQGAKERRFE